MIEFPKDFKEFLQLLDSKEIEYLVVGGYAVGYHGHPRATGDMDVWIAIHDENAQRMVAALESFGFSQPELTKSLFLEEGNVIRMGVPPMRLEIITSIDGVEFNACYRNKVEVEIGNVHVNFISKADLIKNKRSSGRYKDLDDVEMLGHDGE